MASIAALIGAFGLAGSAISAGSSVGAANEQQAADAAALAQQKQLTEEGLDFQKQTFGQEQANLAPYLGAGKTALSSLLDGFQNGTFGLGSIPAFKAPTAAEAAATPGEQFQLAQGLQAIDQGAAARGGLNSGATQQSEQQFGSNLASTTYQNAFGNAYQQYLAALGGQQQNYNQLADVVRTGLSAAGGTNAAAQSTATNISSLLGHEADANSNLITQSGNAGAAGTVGIGNAVTNGLNNATQSYLLSSFLQPNNGVPNTGVPNYVPPQTYTPATYGPTNPSGYYSPINENVPGGLGLPG